MITDAAKAPPMKAPKARALSAVAASRRRVEQLKAEAEMDLVRWSPEEVVAKELLPYKSVRTLKAKCYRREIYCHLDGGRITFTPEDLRMENARHQVAPIAA